jgi:hypothetical protein
MPTELAPRRPIEEPPAVERADHEETPESSENFYEQRLASKLMNPELSALGSVKDHINYTAVKTINTIETVAHAGRDVYGFVKGRVLRASHNRAERKHTRLERKAEGSLFAFRRKKFASKAKAQKKVLDRKPKRYQDHTNTIGNRHMRRQEAVEGRNGVYEARLDELMARAQDAKLAKADRRMRRLERASRKAPVDVRTRERLELRKSILKEAIEQRRA